MATQTLSGTVSSISRFLHQEAAGLGITYTGSPLRDYERQFSATDVSKIYFNSYTVTTTPTTIDLTNLTDSYGQALSFVTVKHLQVVNNDTTNSLTVGGGTNAVLAALPSLSGQNPAAGSPGSCVNLTTNLTVSGSAKIIQLVASAGSIAVDVFIVGS